MHFLPTPLSCQDNFRFVKLIADYVVFYLSRRYGKPMTVLIRGRFFVDTQGKIPYSFMSQQHLLITLSYPVFLVIEDGFLSQKSNVSSFSLYTFFVKLSNI